MMYLSPSEPFQTIMPAQQVDIAIGERKPQFRKATAYHAIVSRAIIISSIARSASRLLQSP